MATWRKGENAMHLRSPHVKKRLFNLLRAHNECAVPVTSFFACAPQIANLKITTLSSQRTQSFVCSNLFSMSQTTSRPSSKPPKLIKCSLFDEKHRCCTWSLCSWYRLISCRVCQSHRITNARHPLSLICPDPTNFPLLK